MNIYRACSGNSVAELRQEMDIIMNAYYSLMDDCKDYPLWQKKLEEDLGGSVSFLGTMMEEADHKENVESSEMYLRFDNEKQKYFK